MQTAPDPSEREQGEQGATGEPSLPEKPLASQASLPELEEIAHVASVFIQRVPKTEFPFPTDVPLNRWFKVLNDTGQEILAAGEVIDFRSRFWRGMQRRYCMYMYLMNGNLLCTSERQRFQCCSRQQPIQEAETGNFYSSDDLETLKSTRVHLANGDILGQIRDNAHYSWSPKLSIDDEHFNHILYINGTKNGNCCPAISCRNNEFRLMDRQHNPVGSIHKNFIFQGSNTTQECFGAKFHGDLHPIIKTLIVAALFDLNISYFERRCACKTFACVLVLILFLSVLVGSILILMWAFRPEKEI